ncbi:MAG: type II secretion system F family protein [Acidobacteria bacterium]|nr:type II secretion system F family protein [Acidobacteriota bacterium]
MSARGRAVPAGAAALLAIAGLLVAATLPAFAADESIRIREVDLRSFPRVEVTVSIDGAGPVSPSAITLTEDGKATAPLDVRRLADSGRTVDVVLAIDTSASMRGAPLAAAIAAAIRFLQALPPGTGIGVISFAGVPQVVAPIGTPPAVAESRIRSLAVAPDTAMYDAVVLATRMFRGTAQRNVVVLSDGQDNISSGSLSTAAGAARGAAVTVFSIGFASADAAALRSLASATGGTFAQASRDTLAQVYGRFARGLSNQYVIGYRSSSPAGSQISIGVGTGRTADHAVVLTPSSPKQEAPARTTSADGPLWRDVREFLRGPAGLPTVLGLTFLASFVLFAMLFGPAARARRERDLARRLAADFDPGDERRPDGGAAHAWIPAPLAAAAARLAHAGGFAESLDGKLERAGLPLRSGEFLALSVVATLLGALAGGLLMRGILFLAIFAAAAAAIPSVLLGLAIRRRMSRLHGQLADTLTILASSLRAGHSFLQALDTVAREIGEPGAQEFGRVVAEARLGRPVTEALNDLAERVGSDDFRWAVMAVNIQREVGGNLAEVLDTVAETIRDRDTIRRQVQVLSAEGRLSMWILTALPIMVGIYLLRVNREYLSVLWETKTGTVMLGVAGSLLVAGIAWMRRMVKIDV